jgi:hypothetical protein
MNKNFRTYTYTARNAEDPDKVVTFTLDNERLRVNLTDLIDETQRVITSESKPRELLHQAKSKVKPALMKAREKVFGPVHVSDVNARLNEERFLVRMWPRIAGLRLAPVQINMGQVDNEDAAEAFVDELEFRKEIKQPAKKFFGPLDYWVGWAGLLGGLMFVARMFIRRYRQQSVG